MGVTGCEPGPWLKEILFRNSVAAMRSCLFWIKAQIKMLAVSEKSRKKTVLYKKRFVQERSLKIIFCEHP